MDPTEPKWVRSRARDRAVGAPTLAAAEKGVLIISHEVADVGEWKKRFEGSRDARKKAGLTERFVMLDANKPNTVIVILEAGSAEAAKKYVADPGFKERIKRASTTGSADIRIGTTEFGGK